jgi:hypothetical protein
MYSFLFAPGLWTNEAAWKIRCEIRRAKGFTPGELFTFSNVPVGEMSQTNYLGRTTNVNGVTVTLDNFVRRPPLTNDRWSSDQLSQVSLHVSGISNDFHLDLAEVRTDHATSLEFPDSSSSGNARSYGFKTIPDDAKTLDFTFAVHQGRWVEFLAKPETGSGKYAIPGTPNRKKTNQSK